MSIHLTLQPKCLWRQLGICMRLTGFYYASYAICAEHVESCKTSLSLNRWICPYMYTNACIWYFCVYLLCFSISMLHKETGKMSKLAWWEFYVGTGVFRSQLLGQHCAHRLTLLREIKVKSSAWYMCMFWSMLCLLDCWHPSATSCNKCNTVVGLAAWHGVDCAHCYHLSISKPEALAAMVLAVHGACCEIGCLTRLSNHPLLAYAGNCWSFLG